MSIEFRAGEEEDESADGCERVCVCGCVDNRGSFWFGLTVDSFGIMLILSCVSFNNSPDPQANVVDNVLLLLHSVLSENSVYKVCQSGIQS